MPLTDSLGAKHKVNRDTWELKREAAYYAVQFVESGMVIGVGAGSTSALALRRIAQLLREGQLRDVMGVPCSVQVEQEALQLGVPLTDLDRQPALDLTIDGADEVDPNLDLIKGAGGALLREKIVAQASQREIIVVDDSKLSPVLGTRRALPLEVIPFGWRSQIGFLEALGAQPVLRTTPEGSPFRTDQGNLILDCPFGPISQPARLASELAQRAGIVEHGLFLGLATDVVIASEQGVRHLRRGEPA